MSNKNILRLIAASALIETIGFSMVIPIFPLMFTEPSSSIYLLTDGIAEWAGYLILGTLFSLYTFAQFFSNPVLGQLSDRYGRRPILISAIGGTGIANLIFVAGIALANLPLLYIGRLIDGLTGGSISIMKSVAADLAESKDRAKNFGMIGAAMGVGIMFGPLVGGVFSNDQLLPWFSPELAFGISAALSLINAAILYFVLHETSPKEGTASVSLLQSVRNIKKAVASKVGKVVFGVRALYAFAFTMFTSFFGVLLVSAYDFSQTEIGFTFFGIGLSVMIFQSLIIPRLDDKFAQRYVLIAGLCGLGVSLILVALFAKVWVLIPAIVLFAASNSSVSTAMTTIISRQTSKSNQGEILGVESSVQSLAQTLPGALAGVIAALFSPWVPVAVSAGLFLAGALAVYYFHHLNVTARNFKVWITFDYFHHCFF
ncbi:MFS transporter [Candidatus Pacebacteria bacterium]|nr:MFS transporter [Candidatus Paceibacterota bacterium]